MANWDDEYPYDADGNLTNEYWDWWINEQGAAASQPLRLLIDEGCVREELLAKLEMLSPPALQTAVSASDLGKRLREIESAQSAVLWLLGSDIEPVVFHDRSKQRPRFTTLLSDLGQMKKVLQGLLASTRITKKRSVRFDSAMDGLIDYVKGATGQFYDEQLSQLMNCVTGRDMSATALKQWRSRRRSER